MMIDTNLSKGSDDSLTEMEHLNDSALAITPMFTPRHDVEPSKPVKIKLDNNPFNADSSNNPFSVEKRKSGNALADETLDLNFDESDMSFNPKQSGPIPHFPQQHGVDNIGMQRSLSACTNENNLTSIPNPMAFSNSDMSNFMGTMGSDALNEMQKGLSIPDAEKQRQESIPDVENQRQESMSERFGLKIVQNNNTSIAHNNGLPKDDAGHDLTLLTVGPYINSESPTEIDCDGCGET